MKTTTVLFTAATAFALLFTSGCSTKTAHSDEDVKTADYIHFTQHNSQKEVRDIILKSGREAGWRMTEFKDNALIAEKTTDGETLSVTVTFTKDSFEISPQNQELQEILEKSLQQ